MQDLQIVENRAVELIEKHLPEGWKFGWNRRTSSNGMCYYGRMEIQLSKVLTPYRTWEDTLNTILHEIGHAIAGPENGHNKTWAKIFMDLGGDGKRCSDDDASINVDPKWVMMFEGQVVKRYFRKPNKSTFDRLPHTWLTGKKAQTYGKLEIVKYNP